MTTIDRLARRDVLLGAGTLGLSLAAGRASGAPVADLHLAGGSGERALTGDFPEKGEMVLQRTRPPLLETPFDVFDKGIFTPNDRFFVRWHLANVPQAVDVETFKLEVTGVVDHVLTLSLADILAMPRVEIAAVNQCSGNSRGYFSPRVPGGQWGHGAMGNAKWTGVPLRAILEKAGVKPGAVEVRFNGADKGVLPDTPNFAKSLDIAHALDGEVMVAFQMNGAQLPLLNGFPLRLVVPGWYSTYWVKMLNSIEVLDKPDQNYWMKIAYRIPDTPGANVKPGEKGFKTVPINKMVPRSFITNVAAGATLATGSTHLRGIAFGGDSGVAKVEVSSDGGATWGSAILGDDAGKYSFRAWHADIEPKASGPIVLQVRATNDAGLAQPATAVWNGGGFMQNIIESTPVTVARS